MANIESFQLESKSGGANVNKILGWLKTTDEYSN